MEPSNTPGIPGVLPETRQDSSKPLFSAAIIIVIGVLATTLAQPQVLGRIPLQNLLKNELHVDRAGNAAFFFWMGLAWYFKPLFGIVTDAFPLFGSRRKSYMVIAGTLATLCWAALYDTLVIANGAISFIAVPLVLLLPSLIVDKKDAETPAAVTPDLVPVVR